MSTIRILLVDDHEVVRLGLKSLLAQYPHFEVVGEADSVASAIRLAAQTSPDVVVLDVRLMDGSGIEACREIRSKNPQTKVLMLTSYSDEEALLGAVLAGAQGYVLKKIWSKDLINAIEGIVKGRTLIDPALVNKVLVRAEDNEYSIPPELEQLTSQEKKVLSLIAEAKTNQEIADTLFISEKTVRNYVSNIFRKLNFAHRAQAVVYVNKLKNIARE
ncbi:LuxR family transcriptional regulator [Clostridiales bacterium PH28_bin88]|nr:LuxR family transcriptional regulator [Clostridiales bacterium PH28_bin88]